MWFKYLVLEILVISTLTVVQRWFEEKEPLTMCWKRTKIGFRFQKIQIKNFKISMADAITMIQAQLLSFYYESPSRISSTC